jgi:hypothetical protein
LAFEIEVERLINQSCVFARIRAFPSQLRPLDRYFDEIRETAEKERMFACHKSGLRMRMPFCDTQKELCQSMSAHPLSFSIFQTEKKGKKSSPSFPNKNVRLYSTLTAAPLRFTHYALVPRRRLRASFLAYFTEVRREIHIDSSRTTFLFLPCSKSESDWATS